MPGVAFADTDGDIDVTVSIAPVVAPGQPALTITSGEVALTENGSTAQARQFTWQLPSVTVTDARSPDQIPPESSGTG